LSIRSVTGKPIKFVGVGEKIDALEPFYPDRMASRILGMGDILTLIDKVETAVDEDKARELEKKLRKMEFSLQDFLEQLEQMKRIGPLDQIMDMIPGFSSMKKKMKGFKVDDKQLKRIEAIILSMTPEERNTPSIICGSRRRRIAAGSGMTVSDVNRLLKQFQEMKKMMKKMTSMAGQMKPGSGMFPFGGLQV
ncbi:MAG: signal recognition particle protein, partial [bacterium]|nr:signal recognition particle protein [bacterium]